jgi:acetyl esterase
MPLDPQVQGILEAMGQMRLDHFERISDFTAQGLRDALDAQRMPVPLAEVAKVEDRTIPGPAGDVPVRVYWPLDPAKGAGGRVPIVVFFHGGGFVFGDLESHDATVRSLVHLTHFIFVSVDYRLAPEHPFPAAPEDCYAATAWAVENAESLGGDPHRVAVAGDSAGGNLAAVVAMMANDRHGPSLAFQLLIYPCTDVELGAYASHRDNASGYLLTSDAMRWFYGHYAAGADPVHAYLSPMRRENLSGLPPALVITAEFDPLRDEGEAYARRLRDAGVPAECVRYDGQVHGFFSMNSVVDRAKDAQAAAAAALRGALAG